MTNERMNIALRDGAFTEYTDYNLYMIKVDYDTTLVKDVIEKFTKLQEFYEEGGKAVDIAANFATKEALGIKSNNNINFQSFGCTAFRADSIYKSNAIRYMGRNYDFKDNTSCMCVISNPRRDDSSEVPYNSMAFAALTSLGIKNPFTCEPELLKLLPFACLDGMNEKGVSIAVLVVDTKENIGVTRQSQKRPNLFTTLAIRYVLDYAESTEKAVDILRQYNMFATGEKDYHFFISDANGNSKVVEYDYKNKDIRELKEKDTQVATNFYVYDEEKFGHGHKRYKTAYDIITAPSVTEEDLWKALEDTSQEYDEDNPTSNTQWSILYNNTNKSAEVVIRRDFKGKKTRI